MMKFTLKETREISQRKQKCGTRCIRFESHKCKPTTQASLIATIWNEENFQACHKAPQSEALSVEVNTNRVISDVRIIRMVIEGSGN